MAYARGSTRTSAARPTGGMPAGRLLALFAVLVAGVYALVFFTGAKTAEPKLGIDLQGGTRVTLTPRTADGKPPSKDQLDQARDVIGKRVNGLGVAGSEVVTEGSNLVITVPGKDSAQARTLGQTAKLYIRPVVNAGQAVPHPPAPAAPPPVNNQTAAQQAAKEISDARKARQNPALATDQAAQAKAVAAMDCGKADPLAGADDPKLPLVACDSKGAAVYILGPSLIDGDQISDATSGFDSQQGENLVRLTFKSAASEKWAKYTAANLGQQAAFVLDSKSVSAPVIQGVTPAGQATSITGKFTASQAKELANQLKFGSLGISFAQSEAQTVSATLGIASLKAGLLAGLIGLIAVLLYCLLYYRGLGFLVLLSLVCSGGLIFGLLVLLGRWLNFTLDLAGIAGFIIGIGMTADSFVILFERIKDEIREGRSFRSAVPRGWARARRTILSSNAVSFIAAAVLYALAAGQVRGFAFTLGMTVVLDTLIVFLVTAPLVHLASRSPFWAKPSVNGLGAVQEIARERRAAAGVPARAAGRA